MYAKPIQIGGSRLFVVGRWPIFSIDFRGWSGGRQPSSRRAWGAGAPQNKAGGSGGRQPSVVLGAPIHIKIDVNMFVRGQLARYVFELVRHPVRLVGTPKSTA